LEGYYQEAGRAGRDGEPADCLLLYAKKDIMTNLWLIENSRDDMQVDPAVEAQLTKQNMNRLQKMDLYCSTKECLRGYILQYFGESPPADCGSCANCSTGFEEVDITTDAQMIISCVKRMRERFGVGVLLDVLRGKMSTRVVKSSLEKLSTFGICKKSSKKIEEVINQLILDGYLIKTTDKYPVVKLGPNAREALQQGAKLTMKSNLSPVTYDVGEYYLDTQGMAKSSRGSNMDRLPVNSELFASLKKLRLDLAKEQSVPAFVIFPDSTLTDMCIKLPTDHDKLLDVSGIGHVKAERYGEAFIGVVRDFVGKK